MDIGKAIEMLKEAGFEEAGFPRNIYTLRIQEQCTVIEFGFKIAQVDLIHFSQYMKYNPADDHYDACWEFQSEIKSLETLASFIELADDYDVYN